MNLTGLLTLLPNVPAFREWLASLETATGEPAPQSILAAARPYVVAGMYVNRPAPLVLVTARSEMAQQLCEQLAIWLPAAEEGGPAVYQFADPDALPYERIHLSLIHI